MVRLISSWSMLTPSVEEREAVALEAIVAWVVLVESADAALLAITELMVEA